MYQGTQQLAYSGEFDQGFSGHKLHQQNSDILCNSGSMVDPDPNDKSGQIQHMRSNSAPADMYFTSHSNESHSSFM